MKAVKCPICGEETWGAEWDGMRKCDLICPSCIDKSYHKICRNKKCEKCDMWKLAAKH